MIFFFAIIFGFAAVTMLFGLVIGAIVLVIWLCHFFWQVFKVTFGRRSHG